MFLIPAIPFLLASACSDCNPPGPGPDPIDPPVVYTGKVETYGYSPAAKPSTFFAVNVNGESQYVYPTPEPHLALFGCEDEVIVEISALKEKVKSVAVRPLSKNYAYTIKGNVITLAMKPLDRIVVEINGDEANPLFLFANPIEASEDKPDPADPNVIRFEAGKIHTRSSIALKSGQKLYIEGGAIVNGAVTMRGASDVEISGGGILNCDVMGSRAIFAEKCTGVTIKDLTVLNTDSWTTFLAECSDISISNYKIVATASSANEWGNQNDALDLLGCENAKIEHCFGYCHDDVFCIKSQKWSYSGKTTGISFTDCIAWNVGSGNSFEIGYETNRDVSDVSFRDIYSIHSAGRPDELRRGAIGIQNGAGGKVSNILYENVYIEDAKEFAIYMRILKSSYDIGTGVEWTPGYIEGITLRNVRLLKQAPRGSVIMGYDASGHAIKDVSFDGVWVDGKKVSSAAEAGIRVTNASVDFK